MGEKDYAGSSGSSYSSRITIDEIDKRLQYLYTKCKELKTTYEGYVARAHKHPSEYGYHLTMARTSISLYNIRQNEINSLQELRIKTKEYDRKVEKDKRKENERNKPIHCGICNMDGIGVEIPNTPVKVCVNCIYSTILECQTKLDWDKNKQMQTAKVVETKTGVRQLEKESS